MKAHKSEATFAKFGWVVLYHVSFFVFITTIGLNIIFGIIVDTFSELRDLKVKYGHLTLCLRCMYIILACNKNTCNYEQKISIKATVVYRCQIVMNRLTENRSRL